MEEDMPLFFLCAAIVLYLQPHNGHVAMTADSLCTFLLKFKEEK